MLTKERDKTLNGSKQLWLFHLENLSDYRQIEFYKLLSMELKTALAWAIKEQFRWFWHYRYGGTAKNCFKKWYEWDTESQLEPTKKVASRIRNHLPNIRTWFKHRISTGVSAGFNSRIQSLNQLQGGSGILKTRESEFYSSVEN